MRRSLPSLLLALACCSLWQACGAGLIVAGAASNSGGSSSSSPELSLPPQMPLVPPENTIRSVTVANAQIATSSRLVVRLILNPDDSANRVAVDQRNPVISAQGGSTVVTFTVETAPIVARFPDPTAQDVPVQLAVLVDGRDVAPPVPVTLLRQPHAVLDLPPGQDARFLAPTGDRVTLRLQHLRATRAEDLQMLVKTVDPGNASATVTRACTNLTVTPSATAGMVDVAATVPGDTFPGQARLFVRDLVAGESTVVTTAWYRPAIDLALPAQGPTTGGRLVTLLGKALIPLDTAAVPPRPDFARIELFFRKGGRVAALDPLALRTAESGLESLVFTMPASPDGRPGQVDIILRADLGAGPGGGRIVAEVVATDVFLFGNPQPVFGPRGALLDRRPIAVAPIALEAASRSPQAPDFAVLNAEGGVSYLQLQLAQENGMFIRAGAARRLGDPQVPAQRDPRTICAGDFNGDGVPDLFVANAGAATATHHFVYGQLAPGLPLGGSSNLDADAGITQCLAGDLNGDGVTDLVLLPGPAASSPLPQVFLSVRRGGGGVDFVRGADVAAVRPGPYDAALLANLDDDGFLDLCVAIGGAAPRLDVAFGAPGGGFEPTGFHLDVQGIGFQPASGSRLVGVHPCGQQRAAPATSDNSLAMVFSGDATFAASPAVAVLHRPPTDPRAWEQNAANVLLVQTGPLGASVAADLQGDGANDLVIAAAEDTGLARLGVLWWQSTRFTLAEVVADPELIDIRSLHFGVAFPAQPGVGGGANAVFVAHETQVDSLRERRLSTLLAVSDPLTGQPGLLPANAGGRVSRVVRGLVGGEFAGQVASSGRASADLALATDEDLRLLVNDGFGGFFDEEPGPAIVGLVPQSVARARVSRVGGDAEYVAVCTRDGRIAIWRPDGTTPQAVFTGDLRALAPSGRLATAAVSSRAKLRSADVDGDGQADLVALLTFELPDPGEGEALLLLLRGKVLPGSGEFPFEEPTRAALVHGNSTAIVLADFAAQGAPAQLELALAVPAGTTPAAADGDHVRFFRYAAGARPRDDGFVRSFQPGGAEILLAGSAPTELAAADFDRNGTIDLLVAAAADSTLRLFLANAQSGVAPGEVVIESFQESLASPLPLAGGVPVFLNLGDINGDGAVDALVTTASATGAIRTAVGFYISSGTGELTGPTFVSPSRLGAGTVRLAIDLVDLNADGVPDLGVGVDDAAPDARNVRVLFGGSR